MENYAQIQSQLSSKQINHWLAANVTLLYVYCSLPLLPKGVVKETDSTNHKLVDWLIFKESLVDISPEVLGKRCKRLFSRSE